MHFALGEKVLVINSADQPTNRNGNLETNLGTSITLYKCFYCTTQRGSYNVQYTHHELLKRIL